VKQLLDTFLHKKPALGKGVYIAPGAVVLGDVTLGDYSNIWCNAVLRGDINRIVVGHHSNIQDNAMLHLAKELPCLLGNYVTVGHGAVIHACTIADQVLVGIGAVILDGAVVGEQSIVGAGAVVNTGCGSRRLPAQWGRGGCDLGHEEAADQRLVNRRLRAGAGGYQGRRTRKNSLPAAGSVRLSRLGPAAGALVTHNHCADGPIALLPSSSVSAMVLGQETVTRLAARATLSCTGLPMTMVPVFIADSATREAPPDTVEVTVQL
jgi:gamma-carbonic anhydrase